VFYAVGATLKTLHEAVSGGCTIMMFGNMVVYDLRMIGACGDTQRNGSLFALSLSIGFSFAQVPEKFAVFQDIVSTLFAENCVMVMFLGAILLNLMIFRDKDGK